MARYRFPDWVTPDIAEWLKGCGSDKVRSLMSADLHTSLISECEANGLDVSDVKHYWHKSEHFSIFSKINERKNNEEILEQLIEKYKEDFSKDRQAPTPDAEDVGVIAFSDFHFGAYVKQNLLTPDFNIGILVEKIKDAVDRINDLEFEEVHICLLGDFIESFTGLNHINSWQELSSWGWSAISGVSNLIYEHIVHGIDNVTKVYVVSGNHDRLTQKKEGDMRGEGAAILADLLRIRGVDVAYHPILLSEKIDGVQYIMTHGHHAISKKAHTQILFEHGRQGVYNVVMQGHWHTRKVEKHGRHTNTEAVCYELSNSRHVVVPPMFTGNMYSTSEGYNSQSGFAVFSRYKKGIDHYDLSL